MRKRGRPGVLFGISRSKKPSAICQRRNREEQAGPTTIQTANLEHQLKRLEDHEPRGPLSNNFLEVRCICNFIWLAVSSSLFNSSNASKQTFFYLRDPAINMPSSSSALTVLVVGATGATGKHVVVQLLQKHHAVRTIVRSSDRLLSSLGDILGAKDMDNYASQLQVTEAAILDLSDEELQKQVDGCDAIVQTLGHNMTFKGMYGAPRKLVSESIRRLTKAAEAAKLADGKKMKVILMGSDGVSHPDKTTDDKRPVSERVVLSLIRALVPPHRDNEAAAKYIYADVGTDKSFEWTVVRPTDLVEAETISKYVAYDKPMGGLFGDNTVSRINVAQFMVDLLISDKAWKTWVYKMPVVHNAEDELVAKAAAALK